LDLQQLQIEVSDWQAKNFPNGEPWEPVMGVAEEVGELSHAFLKKHQGIRLNEDHEAAMKDAVGDVVIYLADVCHRNGFNLAECVTTAWDEVKQRDWEKHRVEHGAG
tara:strand:+ start:1541 stop:1861 length:321 start_codon:yes stop_codon:yes gene_type:complete